jgi:hypothetical protein
MDSRRLSDLRRFYSLLDVLAQRQPFRLLAECDGRLLWPKRGVYFFMEEGEHRSESGIGNRVVRVGSHALTATSKTNLWRRLVQHRGNADGIGGNHRGSVFRLLIGEALQNRAGQVSSTWGQGNSAPREIRQAELDFEQQVSGKLGLMPFIWLDVDGGSDGPAIRKFIEQNAIALLSNFGKSGIDMPSADWLGHHSGKELVRQSGIWNRDHTSATYHSDFISVLADYVNATGRQP